VLKTLNPRLVALMAFVIAAIAVAGCSSAPVDDVAPAPAPMAADDGTTTATADDLTATEAAIAGMNDVAANQEAGPTAQLLRPDAPMSYSVKRGDTLWDIAAVFLRDPWFWPEIWQINPQVENPHLIYPGDVLSLAYGANGDARVSISQYSGARLTPRLRSETLDGPIDSLPFSAISAFLSKPSVLTREEALRAPHILAFRDGHMVGGTGHEIYVEKLNAPLNQRFSVMHVGEPIYDPETRDLVGYQAAFVATAVVNSPGNVTKAVLIEGAREALEGDRLISQESDAPLTFTPHAAKTDVNGQIIAVADGAEQIGQFQIVIVNRGNRHGIAPGVVLAVDQKGAVVKDRFNEYPFKKDAFSRSVALPNERAGTLIIFKTFDRVSYGLVIGARGPMRVADRVYSP
jgi:hypothetical protein